MTAAPTKEMAIGMKISDLAMLPQRTRSESWAARSPNSVDMAGTMMSHRKLFFSASQNFGSSAMRA